MARYDTRGESVYNAGNNLTVSGDSGCHVVVGLLSATCFILIVALAFTIIVHSVKINALCDKIDKHDQQALEIKGIVEKRGGGITVNGSNRS